MSPKVTAITELLKLLTYTEIDELNVFVKEHLPVAPITPFWAIGTMLDEERTNFEVWLESTGPNKIAMIKLLRQTRLGMGLYDAKQLVENTPALFADLQSKDEADALSQKIRELGGRATIR